MEAFKPLHVGHFEKPSSSKAAARVVPDLTATHTDNAINARNAIEADAPRHPIFAASVDPSGTRLATGALDGSIKIWSLSGSDERGVDGKGDFRLLASMSRHTGAVMCLAWSPPMTAVTSDAGHQGGGASHLASGSDDCVILIWKRQDASLSGNVKTSSVFSGEEGEERYTVVKRIAGGHQSDINGVAWSPDGDLLASCGLDNAICIWNAKAAFALTRRIDNAHAGFVKGLAWEPLGGAYLASQSDDRSLAIWRRDDWSTVARLTAPFTASPCSTFFRRPSWSADGEWIAIANAVNGDAPVAMLLSFKDALQSQGGTGKLLNGCISLVGHVTPIEVASFSPRVYQQGADVKNALVAVGSQDGTVSVWTSCSARPLVVLDGLFEHTVLDLAWTPDGRSLIAVSYDGHVVFIRFQSELIGEPVVVAPAKPKAAAAAERTALVAKLDDLLPKSPSATITAQTVQMRDGKRRITPQLLQPSSSQPAPASAQAYLDPMRERVKPIVEIQANYRRTRGKAKRPQVTPIVFMQNEATRAEVVNENTLTVRAHGKFAWKEHFSHPIDGVLLNAADSCLFVACGDQLCVCSIHTGRRLLPPIALDSPIVSMHGNLVVVTEDAVLYVWPSITEAPRVFPIPLLADDTLLRIEEGGQTIELHFKQHTLSHIGGNWYKDSRLVSEYSPLYSISGRDALDEKAEDALAPLESLEHVECELARALLASSTANASVWLKTYVKRCMADQLLVPRLRDLLHSLSSTAPIEGQKEARPLLKCMLEWAREADEGHPFCAELEAVISSSLWVQ